MPEKEPAERGQVWLDRRPQPTRSNARARHRGGLVILKRCEGEREGATEAPLPLDDEESLPSCKAGPACKG